MPAAPSFIDAYRPALIGLAVLATLFFVQFIVLDVARIRVRATPGKAVVGGHDCFVFRAERAHANSAENLGAFLLIVVLGFLVQADPAWVNGGIVCFSVARVLYTSAYYLNWRILRSVFFGIGMLGAASVLIAALGRLG